ncbi:MAG: hypoxanthine/guanine phosphoribosyltransferase [Candidatus Altiarchaeota archaeon]
MALELLRRSLEDAKVIRRGEYRYFVHPLTDSIPPIRPELMKEVCDSVIRHADLDVDYIVTMEAMGIHICAVVSQLTGLPFNIIRKRQYGLPGEIVLDQTTSYSKGSMYINSVKRGDVVTIVDAVVSTGGTLVAVIKALQSAGLLIKDVVCVIERGDGVREVEEETGFKVKTLVKIEVGEKVRVLKVSD